jgi:hypothetical protein
LTPSRTLRRAITPYWSLSGQLAAYWNVPRPLVIARMAAARIRYARGPGEFDEFRFANKPVRAWRDYADRRVVEQLQEPLASPSWRALEEDKERFAQHCLAHDLPTPACLGIVEATAARSVSDGASPLRRPEAVQAAEGPLPRVTSPQQLERLLAEHDQLDGFAKPLRGGKGYGGFTFTVRNGEFVPRGAPEGLKEPVATIQDLFAVCARSRFAHSGYLLQHRVVSHEALRPYMPSGALGTIRIFTFLLPDGRVVIPFAALKVPAPAAETDNGRTGSLAVGIDVETGAMQRAVGVTSDLPITRELDAHPETGAPFPGTRIPCWPEVRLLMDRAAKAFVGLPALGWDVAITPDGPVLVEANWHFFARFAERVTNRGWAADYRRLYSMVAGAERA